MEFNPEAFDIAAGVSHWGLVFLLFTAILLALGLFVCLLTRGLKGAEIFGAAVTTSVKDLFGVAPRRVFAIARLTFKEAIRRKALLVFVVFCIIFMFAGWFLTDGGGKAQVQVKLYVSFVLTSIAWLLMILMLLLSCWGIPEDIRLRSLHTVVTKPTRRIEIVIGRVVGFSAIGLLVLLVMGGAGYIWINRQLEPEQKKALICRVPVYGDLEFLGDTGQPTESGVNVGDMWKFRSYIAGTSRARAIWTFENLDEAKIGDNGLNVESNFEAFRTHKGNMDAGGLAAQYTLVNNRRAEAFAGIAKSNNFMSAANELRLGRYKTGAELLRTLGLRLQANQVEFVKDELDNLSSALGVAGDVILNLDGVSDQDWAIEVSEAFQNCGFAAADSKEVGQAAGNYDRFGESVIALSDKITEHQAPMREYLSRIAVSLPSFIVREYRFGENISQVPRELVLSTPNNEDIARLLSKRLTRLSEAGELTEGDGFKDGVSKLLSDGDFITSDNADRTSEVLAALIADGTLKMDDGQLIPADESQSLYNVVRQVFEDGKLSSQDGWQIKADLVDDLIHKGKLRVEVACLSGGQFLGMARPDLFIRLPDRPFFVGYLKAIASIGMMMILIVTIGVCSSCFVKGPVAIFLTVSFLMIGQPFAYKFMTDLVDQQIEGGGFVEAVIRMAKQLNPNVPLGVDEKVEKVVNFVDEKVIFGGLRLVKNIIPQFKHYSQGTKFVENGFDVPVDACLMPGIMTLLGFVIPSILIGYVALRFRELEAK